MNFDDELVEAWKGVPTPSPDQVTSHRCQECSEVTAFFGGKVWTALLDVDALRYNECALALFTPAAFHYYLPAFIRATLVDPVRADVIADGIVSSIRQDFGPADRGHVRLFTPAQRALVARFLRALPALRIFDEQTVEDIETLAQLLADV